MEVHQRRNKGAKVGRQAQTMPMKGSQQDQMKTPDMAQVRSTESMRVLMATMRTMDATQTLEDVNLLTHYHRGDEGV